jgi:hypothetical protein
MALASVLGLGPLRGAAQSAGQLGAWDGLILSPIGALAPVARDPGYSASGVDELLLRYGRWRYDSEDAVHDNIGLTWAHSLGFARTEVAITGAYQLVECPTCSAWAIGGVDLRSTLWTRDVAPVSGRMVRTAVGLSVSMGGARYLAAEASTSVSVAATLPIDVAFPLAKTSTLCASIVPGLGFGRITGADVAESGVLPMIGAAIAWTATPRIGVDVGLQRIIIAGGPIQVGAAISLKMGSGGRSRP